MVFPILPAILGAGIRFGLTATSLRSGVATFAGALPFGAGYSFGTYLGFPKNYQSRRNSVRVINLGSFGKTKMPFGYGYGSRRRYSRYSRYQPFRRRRYYPRRASYRRRY